MYSSIGSSVMNNALSGIQKALAKGAEGASELASKKSFEQDIQTDTLKSILKVKQATTEVQANAKVIQIADDALGSLLDDFA